MEITGPIVAEQLAAYLHHRINLNALVDWSERQIMEGEFQSQAVRDVVARLGVADVRAFGLTWEDCERLLRDLGFEARVDIVAA